ncbi:unnamed protein product [Rangifer tarandus platyrhynchus]|uniref:Uncharacterized protein n=2 Tax=Rangifer tarandus platyrhynchus TaxID=3082113 RepID=A0ABN8XT09_RANTA|nr:unnamed protein product [Rangifer tarandus platyrhynchus]CAI9691365.1 unnamed protein product [Rangifer tarandus platyrhynchus]
MAAGAAAAERRRRQLLGREGAKGASCPPTSHSSLLAFSPFVLPPHPTRAAERARPPARARVYLGSSLAAPTNHRLRPPCAPASQYALPLGRLLAQSSPSPRPLSSQPWRGPSRERGRKRQAKWAELAVRTRITVSDGEKPVAIYLAGGAVASLSGLALAAESGSGAA